MSKSSDNVLINVGKIRGASALGYDTFMTEEAISKLTELIHPSTNLACSTSRTNLSHHDDLVVKVNVQKRSLSGKRNRSHHGDRRAV